ncbi:GNAT family N-acetyltransferase [Bacillus sp. S/N-304-OC-R1]|nr:GNAT family N-acetyltransferase [Bacillus sp. S/N-304-OC-R1]
MPLLGNFYRTMTSQEPTVFWWVGDEGNWKDVICAFKDGKMIAKGQIQVISVIPSGRSNDSKHSIYINLKALPNTDTAILNQIYERLYNIALLLKETLPNEYETLLCVGNFQNEVENNLFFTKEKGFNHLNTLYSMKRDLEREINETTTIRDYQLFHWNMESPNEEQEYLKVEAEIWPEAALGLNRLREYKSNEFWTSINVRENGTIVGNAMAWKELEGDNEIGIIEDVFVRENWRKQGIAKHILTKSMLYLKEKGLTVAKLQVETTNEKALNLYKSVGFEVETEELRFFTILK